MGRTAGGSFEEETAREAVFGRLLGAHNEALRRLLKAPAPDPGGLAAKIALMIEHEVATLDGGEACLAAILADARRFAAGPDD